ncbi:MAG TPA: prepilin-type N-terminal cleavage/methylation domain-containing protein [Blastocatellia bacterium]|nr:prepilin-type N-terminal cleavage/methylation domain-containing protein [Blastocatellia bacterium]
MELARKSESGFSLIEVTVALLMLTTVVGVAFSLLNRFQTSYRYEESYADAQRNARFAMARLNEVVRSAGTNPTATTSVNPTDFAVLLAPTTVSGTAVSSSAIQLKSDLNGDTLNTSSLAAGDVIVTSENVTIRLDQATSQIVMVDNTPSGNGTIPIADNIRAITFTDLDGTSNTNKAIQVKLVAVPSGILISDPRYREVSYTGVIRLRNR